MTRLGRTTWAKKYDDLLLEDGIYNYTFDKNCESELCTVRTEHGTVCAYEWRSWKTQTVYIQQLKTDYNWVCRLKTQEKFYCDNSESHLRELNALLNILKYEIHVVITKEPIYRNGKSIGIVRQLWGQYKFSKNTEPMANDPDLFLLPYDENIDIEKLQANILHAVK